jgi:hypothetical protein
MKDDTNAILDDLLVQWHRWSKSWSAVPQYGVSAMFSAARSSRQLDDEDELADHTIRHGLMESLDFHIGELKATYRTALGMQARNPATGQSVWSSVRLPQDPRQRAVVLAEARAALLGRLRGAGVV